MTKVSSLENYTVLEENMVYDNENYTILINNEGTGYGVMNVPTGVIEFEAISLPECMFAAENLNVVLVHKTYEWVGKRAREQTAKEAGNVISLVEPD